MSASDREEPAPKEGGKAGQRGAAEDAPFGKEPVFAKATDDAPREPAPPPDESGVNRWIALAQKNTWIAVPLLLPAAIIVGMLQGAQAVVLLLLGAMLVAVITLFWNSIRTLLGETPLSGADAYAIAAPRAEEEQKQAVLRALKDLEFERSVGKISDEDYAVLVAKYRGEAKRLLRAIEEEARPRRESVEWLVHQRLVKAGLAPAAETYRSGAADIGAKADPIAEAKKDQKKKKMKGADRPVVPPRDVAKALAKRSDHAPKPHVDVTLKSSDAVTRTKESAAYVPPTKICAECGVKNDPDANFCKKCGSKAFEGAAVRDAKKPAAEAQDAPADAGSDDEASKNESAEAAENESSENEADHDKEAAR